MTDTKAKAQKPPKLPKPVLSRKQRARIVALDASRKVLAESPGLFAGAKNDRSIEELIAVSEYILGAHEKAPREGLTVHVHGKAAESMADAVGQEYGAHGHPKDCPCGMGDI